MPNPVPAMETDTVPVSTLSPFAPDSHSPSRETHVEGYNPEEHKELTFSCPNPDRREVTVITTSARKSKYKSTDIAGARQPSRPKKQTIGVGKRVFVERKHLKYMFDPTSESFAIIEMNSSDKFRFFGSVVGKANKLNRVKLDLLPSSANEVCISRSSIEVLAPGQEEEPYTPLAQAESEMIQECSEVAEGGSGKSKFVEQSYSHFTNLPVENQAIASEFVLKYGQEEESVIHWRILSEEEQITECPMERERSSMAEVQAVHDGPAEVRPGLLLRCSGRRLRWLHRSQRRLLQADHRRPQGNHRRLIADETNRTAGRDTAGGLSLKSFPEELR